MLVSLASQRETNLKHDTAESVYVGRSGCRILGETAARVLEVIINVGMDISLWRWMAAFSGVGRHQPGGCLVSVSHHVTASLGDARIKDEEPLKWVGVQMKVVTFHPVAGSSVGVGGSSSICTDGAQAASALGAAMILEAVLESERTALPRKRSAASSRVGEREDGSDNCSPDPYWPNKYYRRLPGPSAAAVAMGDTTDNHKRISLRKSSGTARILRASVRARQAGEVAGKYPNWRLLDSEKRRSVANIAAVRVWCSGAQAGLVGTLYSFGAPGSEDAEEWEYSKKKSTTVDEDAAVDVDIDNDTMDKTLVQLRLVQVADC
ncbi:hypothetical protein EDB19DRAFT_1836647 [Suillus lakei]|nr:hypothetical protein EDB19DRAFT_1836647 [Suillus lakei]